MGQRPPGMLGLETALAVTLTELVEPGYLDLATAVERLTSGWRVPAGAGAWGTGGAGGAGQPGRARPGGDLDGRPGQAGTAGPATRRSTASSCAGGSCTRCCGGLHGPRRAGPAVTAGGARG